MSDVQTYKNITQKIYKNRLLQVYDLWRTIGDTQITDVTLNIYIIELFTHIIDSKETLATVWRLTHDIFVLEFIIHWENECATSI